MPVSFTPHTLEKLEVLLKELGYKVRYEKGNFRTGSCIIESSKVVIVNKFSNLESKIISLTDLIKSLDNVNEVLLNDKQKQFYYLLKQTRLQF